MEGLPPVLKVVVPICRVVPSDEGDVKAHTGGRSSVNPDRTVVSKWYRSHYRLSVESVGGTVLSTPDWSI
jgi:hypothetical protein